MPKRRDLTATLSARALDRRHPGVTRAIGAVYYEALCVALARHHISPVSIVVHRGALRVARTAAFQKPSKRARDAWANETDTTANAAYAICLVAVEDSEGLVAVHRAETQTGADYYVAPPGKTLEDLEACFRLEVSGVNEGGQSVLAQRLKEKVAQTRRGRSNLPAIATVAGFRELTVLIERVEP